VEYGLRALGRVCRKEAIADVLKNVGLGERASQTARTLSTGQKRRLTLALILLAQPRILLLDEPSNGLDSEGVELCLKVLEQMRAAGSGVLVATHDPQIVGWCGTTLNLREWAK
jgi:ABC-type multidrug transport system ATPase subunit